MPQTDGAIKITRGDAKELVVTAFRNGTVIQHLSHFKTTFIEQSQNLQVLSVNFTAQCRDEALYYCESSGKMDAINITVSSKYLSLQF